MPEGKQLSRRTFFRQSAAAAAGISLSPFPVLASSRGRLARQEARYYKKLDGNRIQCMLCPWQCVVEPGRRGRCEVRENQKGIYYSLVYGKVAAHHKDPIEKKPFYHFLPGTSAFSIATAGCNVDCKFCQNWDLARRRPEEISSVTFSPEDVVEYAIRWKCQSISFTYNEPTVFNEFVQDVADAGRPRGIKQCIVSNGFISRQPLLDLSGRIDAYKVDLKSFSEDYYRDVVHGRLQPVLDTLITLKSRGIWTEIVYLTVPTLNDNTGEVKEMIRWILRELGPDVPIHFSKFYPRYKLRNLPPTPVETLERLRKVALDGGLHYVYIGNVPGHEGENTYCPGCGKLLIGRYAYQIFAYHVHGGKCEYCGESIAGLWS